MSAEAALVRDVYASRLEPEPDLTIDEWSDTYRILSPVSSAEAGPWRTSRFPFLRKIMRELSPSSPTQVVVFQKGSQVGATETGSNWIGYVMDQAPGPMMNVLPTVDMAKRSSKQRIEPMIRDTPRLKSRVRERRERDSGNTLLAKEFAGGILVMTGANSAVGLRSMPARYLFADEVDGYPGDADGEGDPLKLALRAVRNFPRRKVFIVSTPKIAGLSRVERELENCDQKWTYHVPCPLCGTLQALDFARLVFTVDSARASKVLADSVAYRCLGCDELIAERHKPWMLSPESGADWVAEWNRGRKSVGFFLSALYSPLGFFSWADAIEMHLEAEEKQSDELRRIFHNTVLGIGHQEVADAPSWQRLYDRRESYPIGAVPPGALFLTAGVDVQHSRLEYEVVGWGRGRESWSIEYGVLDGDPARPEVWRELERLVVAREFPCATGEDARGDAAQLALTGLELPPTGPTMPVRVTAVDSGDQSQSVYAYVRAHPQPYWGPAGAVVRQPRTVVATKGREHALALVGSATRADTAKRFGLRVYSVGTWMAKIELYGFLRLERPTDEAFRAGETFPDGYVHVPEYGEEYFKQLTAERLVKRVRNGFPKLSWEKDAGRRNEALDCRVYARAAAELFGISRFTEKHWAQLGAFRRRSGAPAPVATELGAPTAPPAAPPDAPSPFLETPQAPAPRPPAAPAVRRASFVSSWMNR